MDQTEYLNAPVIDEKEELIAALTQQLEYAAEQLDRYQRAGTPTASGSNRTSSGQIALSPEMNEGLTRFLEQWDQMQAGFTLGRIEVQLNEIKDLVSRAGGSTAPTSPSSSSNDLTSILSAFKATPANAPASSQKPYEPNSWEKIKSSFLGGPGEAVSTDHVESSPDWSNVDSNDFSAPAQSHQHIDPVAIINILGLELPDLVDFENASSEELVKAIESRDDALSTLLEKTAEIYQRATHKIDLTSLQGFESEKAAIDELHDRLTEQLKIAELQNSLERARLSREQSKLNQKEMLIEKKLLQLGITSEQSGDQLKQAGKPEPKRGWLR